MLLPFSIFSNFHRSSAELLTLPLKLIPALKKGLATD